MTIARHLHIGLLLVQNAALPALGVMGYCHVRQFLQRRLRPRAELLLLGAALGILGALSVLGAIDAGDGVRLDLRNAMTVVATTFGGLEAGAATTAIIALCRAALGGGGVAGGLASLAAAFALSAGNLMLLRRRGGVAADRRNLAWLGLAAGVAGLAVIPLFPGPTAAALVLHDIAPAWVILMPLTVMFLGGTMLDFERARAVSHTLQEKERQLCAILDNAPVAIFLKDREARYRMVNRCFSDWTGHRQEDLCGRSGTEAFPSAFAGTMEGTDREVLAHGRVTQTEISTAALNCPNSGVAHALVTKFPIRDGGSAIVGIAGFGLDVSKRKQAEEALRASEQRFRALIEHSADVVAILRADGTMSYRGPSRAAKLLGYDEAEVIGTRVFDRMHPDDAEAAAATLADIARASGGEAEGRSRMRHKDGSWRYIAWSGRNAIGIPGIDGVILNCRDVTKAVSLELQLMQAQKMEAVGQLASGIAHEFNNIVGAILGFAGFLLQDLPESAPQRRLVGRIITAATAARNLVQQILAFSRPDDGGRKPQDLGRLMLEASELLRASLPSATRLELVPPAEGLVAVVNAGQITQVLLNLCLNANDALRGSPGDITIELSRVLPGDMDFTLFAGDGVAGTGEAVTGDARVVAGTLRHDRSYGALAVRDTGTGMEQGLLERIFEPFFTTKEPGCGSGLGLAVVHGTVTAHEGACLVTSRPGAGSTFKIYLPLAETDAEPEAPEPAPVNRIACVDRPIEAGPNADSIG